MALIFLSIGIAYAILIVFFWKGLQDIKPTPLTPLHPEKTTPFSIIIPFRNEASRITPLLHSIAQLDYPTNCFEICFIDDYSTDQTVSIVNDFFKKYPTISYQIISSIGARISPKKEALHTGILNAKNEWIVCTDADCELPVHWLVLFNQKINSTALKMIAGSVLFKTKKGILNQFQYDDLLSLQGVTLGSFQKNIPFMCNGANFAYQKSFYKALNGFESTANITSGDDVFLLQKAHLIAPKSVGFIFSPDHTVFTANESSWIAVFNQRVRWAAKTANYPLFIAKAIAILVFITNLSLLIAPFYISLTAVILSVACKITIDMVFIIATAHLFKQKQDILSLLISSLIYPFFSTTVALYSLFGKFEWKEKRFKK